jgi:hypothetical protein
VKLYLLSPIRLPGIVPNLVQELVHLNMIQSSERPFQDSNRALLLKLTATKLYKKLRGLYGNLRFSIVFKKARQQTVC